MVMEQIERPAPSRAVRVGDIVRSTLELPGGKETVGAMLARNAARFGDQPAYCEKRGGRFHAVSWEDFLCEVAAFSRFLADGGVGKGDRVAVFSPNRSEMLVTEFAVMCLGAVYVPIFPGYPTDQNRTLLENSAPTAIVVADREQLEAVSPPPSVRLVVSYDPIARAALDDLLGGREIASASFGAALRRHAVGDGDDLRLKAFLWSASRLDPDDPCLLMYTSGTAGRQKGDLLTHDNLLSQQRALSRIWSIGPRDRFLSYLPWHHSFGGIFEKYSALTNGAALHLDDSYGKDFDLLLRNLREVRPTVYFSVPKIYQQLVDHARFHPADEERIFHPGLQFLFTAAAPLPENLSSYFESRGIPVLEGWGLTETSPCCTITDPAEPRRPGLVGYPLPGIEVRLAPDGEILVRGPNIMRAYHGDPEATRAAISDDGWFATGDLGELHECGLRLIARKDRLFKMLNAEKIVPTDIETALQGMTPYIRHVIVVGEGREFLAALVYPNFFLIDEEFGSDRERARRTVKDALIETLRRYNTEQRVKYQRLLAFAVIGKELTVEDHELTPSLKVRVRNVLRNAEEYVDAIYEPTAECGCAFLSKVVRLAPESRRCFGGRDVTIDRCHECGDLVFGTGREKPAGAPRPERE